MGQYIVVWRSRARKQYIEHLAYFQMEFGSKAFFRWVDSVHKMEEVLRNNPRQYGLVPLLQNRAHEYRGCNVMKNFKIIYAFDERKKVVNIVSIWDMRMNPERLKRSIR